MRSDGNETKIRLLAEARDLYVEEGPAHFSLREVARRAGVSAAAVYRHYDGKEALFEQVCAAGLQVFYGYLVRALSEPTPRARVFAAATQYLHFGLENPRDYRVLFMGAGQGTHVPAEPSKGKPHATFQFLIDRVHECMRAGILRKGNAEEVATVIWAHVHGLVSLRLVGQLARAGTEPEFARFYQRSTEQLVAGLSP
ncbi:MAG: TetR/AcrR family transcriptional regulator [Myxococcota bacterium]|nr:TetR/AcrR family transcriptional regulator [Myxococcota bacterium]